MINQIQSKGIALSIQTKHCQKFSTPPRRTQRRGSHPPQNTLQQNCNIPLTQIKDKDDIARLLLDKMMEISKQLEKYQDFEDHIKNILIPVLNHFLNLNQLDVSPIISRSKNRPENSWRIQPSDSMIRIEGTMF